ncbi:MAG TPA: hypothetical protein PK894_07605 [Defluviitoga sp.]|jgi:hypothetical protein|nr:hypothetical protein [Candidatus Pacearchaeota archaeon]HQD63445.1 hypothetical protein [Defluviitoga sp.]
MSTKNYWCYRIDTNRIKFFMDELNNGRLRQGWGWDERQNLREIKMDKGARRNLPMFNKVKKGDILLIPQLPTWGEIAVVEATDDWSSGYQFNIDKTFNDYGHIFPAKFIKRFTRNNENVSGNLRSTLKNPSRFWNINHYSDDVERLLNVPQDELIKKQDIQSRLTSVIGDVFNNVFDEQKFTNELYKKLIKQFTREEWEFALVNGLKELFPFYQIERVGGKEEKNHGTDILIKLPSLLDNYEYAIAIQVKDYEGTVGQSVIDQINKADNYWESENLKLIEKWVIITKSSKDVNTELLNNNSNVKIIFADELKDLFNRIAKNIIGMK